MRIGYLDDEYDILKSAMRSLKKYDIEIVALKNIDDVTNITMLTDAIISDSLECLLVDYDLMKLESKVYGTQIIKDINEILPDFTCFLLTNFTEQGINEKCYLSLPRFGFCFSSWAYPPFLFARIRAYFLSLTANRFFTFLSDLFRYSCPYILQIAAIRCSHQIPFHCRIHLHSCPYPLVIH